MKAPAPGALPQSPGVLLAALRWAWDGLYLIGDDNGKLLIIRADGHGSFRAADPPEARDAIVTDHARRPMQGAVEAGVLQRRLDFERANPHVTWHVPSLYYRATWSDPATTEPQEEIAVTTDGLLRLLRDRGFKW
jgi:hypothetical protein